jgi:hypothetical protein
MTLFLRLVLQLLGANDPSYQGLQNRARKTASILWVRLSTPGRHPKTSGFDVIEGRI